MKYFSLDSAYKVFAIFNIICFKNDLRSFFEHLFKNTNVIQQNSIVA